MHKILIEIRFIAKAPYLKAVFLIVDHPTHIRRLLVSWKYKTFTGYVFTLSPQIEQSVFLQAASDQHKVPWLSHPAARYDTHSKSDPTVHQWKY